MREVQFESTVANGFPVLVNARIAPPEPSVGIMGPEVYDIEILTPKGKSAYFIEKKITKAEWDHLYEEALSQ